MIFDEVIENSEQIAIIGENLKWCWVVIVILLSIALVFLFALLAFGFYQVFIKLFKRISDTQKRLYFLLIISLIGFVIRVLCVIGSIPDKNVSFTDYLLAGFQSLYALLGVFTFEGIDSVEYLPLLFVITTIWIAVTYTVTIATSFNYELQSSIRLFFRRNFGRFFGFKLDRVYIFTEVNDESISIAKSIELNRKRIVIFAFKNGEQFDRKNEGHRIIRDNNLYYIDISEVVSRGRRTNDTSVISSLKLRKRYAQKFNIFACARKEKYLGDSIKNTNYIKKDFIAFVDKYYSSNTRKDNVSDVIFYHAYVENDVKLNLLNNLWLNLLSLHNNENEYAFFLKRVKDVSQMDIYKILRPINAYSYSSLLAKDYISKQLFKEYSYALCALYALEKVDKYHLGDFPQVAKTRRILFVGFSSITISCLKELYIASTGMDENCNPFGFIVDIYDNNLTKETINKLASDYPMFIFNYYDEDDRIVLDSINLKDIVNLYKGVLNDPLKELGLPIFNFHNNSMIDYQKNVYDNVIVSHDDDIMTMDDASITIDSLTKKNISDQPLKTDIAIFLKNENNCLYNKQLFGDSVMVFHTEKVFYAPTIMGWSYKGLKTVMNGMQEESPYRRGLLKHIGLIVPILIYINSFDIDAKKKGDYLYSYYQYYWIRYKLSLGSKYIQDGASKTKQLIKKMDYKNDLIRAVYGNVEELLKEEFGEIDSMLPYLKLITMPKFNGVVKNYIEGNVDEIIKLYKEKINPKSFHNVLEWYFKDPEIYGD